VAVTVLMFRPPSAACSSLWSFCRAGVTVTRAGIRFLNTLYARRNGFIRNSYYLWEDLCFDLIEKLEEALGHSITGHRGAQ